MTATSFMETLSRYLSPHWEIYQAYPTTQDKNGVPILTYLFPRAKVTVKLSLTPPASVIVTEEFSDKSCRIKLDDLQLWFKIDEHIQKYSRQINTDIKDCKCHWAIRPGSK